MEIPELVKFSYKGDDDLLKKYHISEYDLKQAVTSTVLMIEGMSRVYDLIYYKIIFDKKPIGYFIIYENTLYSYAINIQYRKPEILNEWWNQVKKVLGNNFISFLYKNNTRAIKFLEKNGMKILQEDKETNSVILVN